jgi:hypothetical protein
MSVTVLSQNAFAPPADPMNQYYIELRGTIQVGASVFTIKPVWTDPDFTMLSAMPSLTGGPDFDRTLHHSELLQGFLYDAYGGNGNLYTRYVRYANRAIFPVGLAICLYRIDSIGRIQEIDDYRDPAVFPGAISAKGLRTI